MSKFTWIIDAGHGGWKDGKYQTKPTDGKFFNHGNGFIAYEGVTNRKIAKLLQLQLTEADIDFVQLYHDWLDSPTLGLLQQKAKAIQEERKNCALLSIHSNAGKGYGIEVINSIGQDFSDPQGEIFYQHLVKGLTKVNPKWAGRPDTTDGDHDKEMKLAMISFQNIMPSNLVELLFFDEIDQAKYLNSEQGQSTLANLLFNAIKEIELS